MGKPATLPMYVFNVCVLIHASTGTVACYLPDFSPPHHMAGHLLHDKITQLVPETTGEMSLL